MENEITILVDGATDGVPAERFLEAVQRALVALRELDSGSSDDGKSAIRWHITRASTNTPLALTLTPRISAGKRDNRREVARSFVNGLRKIESGRGLPSDFNDEALRATRDLIGLLDRGIARLQITATGLEPVSPTLRSAATLDEQMQRRAAVRIDDSTIEGTLEVVSIHGGESVDVFDQLTGSRVRCLLPEGLLAQAIASLGKRVSVSGRTHFNDKGRPTSIEVESLRVLRERVPSPWDFEGRGKLNITGGIDSAEFVRKIRDA